jgi:hypothetical protein
MVTTASGFLADVALGAIVAQDSETRLGLDTVGPA